MVPEVVSVETPGYERATRGMDWVDKEIIKREISLDFLDTQCGMYEIDSIPDGITIKRAPSSFDTHIKADIIYQNSIVTLDKKAWCKLDFQGSYWLATFFMPEEY